MLLKSLHFFTVLSLIGVAEGGYYSCRGERTRTVVKPKVALLKFPHTQQVCIDGSVLFGS